MNHLIVEFFKSVTIPIVIILTALLLVDSGSVNVSAWQLLIEQAPLLLFSGAIVVALRFRQSRVIYILLFMLLSWALFSEVDGFAHFNFSPSLWFISQLLVLTLFSFDQNKTIWGRHGILRLLILLFIVVLNYRFNHSITLHQWLDYRFIESLPHVKSIGQVELFVSLGCLLAVMFKQITAASKSTLCIWVIMFFLVYYKLFSPDLIVQQLGFAIFGILLIYGVLTDSYKMAFSDELTGLAARRALLQSSLSLGKKYTVAMMDVDHFKKFNDTYGHDVGDQVLRMVAAKINQVKGGGKAYRYGGEEFTVVFPNKSVNYSIPYLEQVRETIANYAMTIRDEDDRPDDNKQGKSNRTKQSASNKTVNVTISIGVAEREGELKDFDQVMKQADEALYRAKQAGRNCLAE
ncbi:MAG: GGDEF domain-containing protein [Gammaproteobacteria bacterium]|nr:GGDEF domain-containing protein [Gammaproteobacteria bacterium]